MPRLSHGGHNQFANVDLRFSIGDLAVEEALNKSRTLHDYDVMSVEKRLVE
jgi:hypothetical protein